VGGYSSHGYTIGSAGDALPFGRYDGQGRNSIVPEGRMQQTAADVKRLQLHMTRTNECLFFVPRLTNSTG
jgi:hypothetical protein